MKNKIIEKSQNLNLKNLNISEDDSPQDNAKINEFFEE